jgi:O-antigen ligase
LVVIAIIAVFSFVVLLILFVKDRWLPIIILSMPIREISLGKVGPADIRIGDLILLSIIIFWLFNLNKKKRPDQAFIRNKLDIAIILFLIINVISILWAPNLENAIVRSVKLIRNSVLFYLIKEALYLDFRGKIKQLTSSIIFTGLIISLVAIYFILISGGAAGNEGKFLDGLGTSQSKPLAIIRGADIGGGVFLGGIGSWLLLCFFLGMGRIPQLKNLNKLINIGFILIIFGMLLLSTHRSVWSGLAGGLVVYCFYIFRKLRAKQRNVFVLLSAAVALLLIFLNFHSFIYNRLSYSTLREDPSIAVRFRLWETSLDYFKQSPIIGAGTASVKSTSEDNLGSHNLYLQILAELGMVGFAAFAWMLTLWIKYLIRLVKRVSKRKYSGLNIFLASVLASSVGYLICAITAEDFESMEPWILLSITSALYAIVRNRKDEQILNQAVFKGDKV